MDNIFIGKHNCKLSTKVTTKVKDLVSQICASREITESQYLRLALQNQLNADGLAETIKNPQQ
jgi:hypothetical protein